jgi:hypothetical protein
MSAKNVEIARELYEAFASCCTLLGASQVTVRESTEP